MVLYVNLWPNGCSDTCTSVPPPHSPVCLLPIHQCASSPFTMHHMCLQVMDESEMASYSLKLEAWQKSEEEKKHSFAIIDVSTKSPSQVWIVGPFVSTAIVLVLCVHLSCVKWHKAQSSLQLCYTRYFRVLVTRPFLDWKVWGRGPGLLMARWGESTRHCPPLDAPWRKHTRSGRKSEWTRLGLATNPTCPFEWQNTHTRTVTMILHSYWDRNLVANLWDGQLMWLPPSFKHRDLAARGKHRPRRRTTEAQASVNQCAASILQSALLHHKASLFVHVRSECFQLLSHILTRSITLPQVQICSTFKVNQQL